MKYVHLYERIQYLIDIFTKNGSVRAFALKIKAAQPTLSKNINDKDNDNLKKYIEPILLTFPNISVEWLMSGTGEAPKFLYEKGNMSVAENAKQQRIGDLLHVVLEYYGISNENIIKHTSILPETLDAVLKGIIFPDFSFLEELYNTFEINPAYFMHGNEYLMRESKYPFDRILFAIGEYKTPSHFLLQRLFGIDKYEAKEYLKAYKEAKKKFAIYGHSKDAECDDNDEKFVQWPILKKEWVQYFIERTELNPAWFWNFQRPIVTATDEKINLYKQVDELNSENERLKRELSLTRTCLEQYCPNIFNGEAINQ